MNDTLKTMVWALIAAAGLAFLTWRAMSYGAGTVYVKEVPILAEPGTPNERVVDQTTTRIPATVVEEEQGHLSWPRTFGVWVAAILTLCIFSFLFGDNVFYKLAESIFVGVSAAYAMVVAFWTAVMAMLVTNLVPDFARQTYAPSATGERDLFMLVPLAMGIMLLWRLAPVGNWIARWPLAFFIAVFAGLRLVAHFNADFIVQIRSAIVPLIVFATDGSFDWKSSLKNTTMVFGTLACLTYFFFSVEHTGVVGKISRVGIYFLMIAFGTGFALTAMSRYSLLIGRLEFLLREWLRL